MRKILNWAFALAMLLPATATAGTEFYHYMDGSVFARYSIDDPGGCIRTDITLNAYEGLTKNGPGPSEATPGLMVNVDRVDWCNQAFLMSAFGSSDDLEIEVGRSLTTASVQGRAELYDSVGGGSTSVDVDLHWAGNGSVIVSTDNNFAYGPSFRILARGSSRRRSAEVTGDLRLAGVSLVAGSAGEGNIVFEKGSLVTIPRIAALAPFPLPTAPPVAPGDLFSYRGGTAGASFVVIDPAGCITTEVQAGGSDSVDRFTPGPYQPTTQLGVFVNRIDWCNSVTLLLATSRDFTGSLQINHGLTSATAQGSVQMDDHVSGTSFTVEVDLAWVGEGPLSGRRDRLFASFPNYRSMTRESSRTRDAEASGAVVLAGTNLLTGPSQSASLMVGEGMMLTWR